MARKEKKFENQTIEDIEYNGYGVTKPADGPVIFVEDALPGEVVDVTLHRKKRRHAFAHITAVHRYSPERVAPFCRHFSDCGGCKWQYLPYERQCYYKARFVEQVFDQIARVRRPSIDPLVPAETDRYYRNRLDFSFSSRRWLTSAEISRDEHFEHRNALGFHVRGSFDKILEIEECFLQPEPSNRLRNSFGAFAREKGYSFFDPVGNTGLLRSLILRTTRAGELMVILVFGYFDESATAACVAYFKEAFPEITSLYTTVNSSRNDAVYDCEMNLQSGRTYITEEIDGVRFQIGPKSFFQTNPVQAERLYGIVLEWAALRGDEVVYDLYCGTGSISLLAARNAAHVYGVESVSEAIEGARTNQMLNGIENCTFVHGQVEKLVDGAFPDSFPEPDLVIVDPPRAGLHPRVVETLNRQRPRRIIYVSCKPSTQARDIALLDEQYSVVRMQPVDMFPQTYHIENIVEMVRR